jgi:hypothetical protein
MILEEAVVTHLPRVGDVLKLSFPEDKEISVYTVSEVSHGFSIFISGVFKQTQIEITCTYKGRSR